MNIVSRSMCLDDMSFTPHPSYLSVPTQDELDILEQRDKEMAIEAAKEKGSDGGAHHHPHISRVRLT